MTLPILFFAAGLGTRMKPLTDDRPKPLIKVGGKPLLDHARDVANAVGATPQVVNLHYKGQMIRDHLADQDVFFSDETDLLRDTGGGLRHALPLLGEGPVITMNTDAVWSGPNPIGLLLAHWQPHMEALLLVVPKRQVFGHKGKGDFAIDSAGHLHRGRDCIYSGVQIIRPDILSETDEEVFSLNPVWDRIGNEGGLYGVHYGGYWCDVGQPESIPMAEALCRV